MTLRDDGFDDRPSSKAFSKDAARDYVKALPRQDRLMVMLRYAEGLSVNEVSMVLDIGYATVQRRMAEIEEEVRQVVEARQANQAHRIKLVVDRDAAELRKAPYGV